MEEKKMPLKVRRFCTSILLVLFSFIAAATAQTQPAANTTPSPQATLPQTIAPVRTPTAGEVMRDRISKAKAFIAVRNYNAAIYELESIRRESNDTSVHAVTNVLLMNSYLEQGDYKRAQDFLTEFFNANKTSKPNASANYFAIASQVVKGARNRLERYRSLGLNVSDRDLPLEAVNDIEKMRETLEMVVTHSKEIGKDKNKTPDAMALLEEAGNSRSMMARDDYDARRWRDEVSDTREQITSSRSVVINAVNDSTGAAPVIQDAVATNVPKADQQTAAAALATGPGESGPMFKPVPTDTPAKQTPPETLVAAVSKPIVVGAAVKEEPKKSEAADEEKVKEADQQKKMLVINNGEKEKADETTESTTAAAEPAGDGSPLEVGSLIGYATRQAQPVYPAAARSMRASGTVKVEVTVDEAGEVAEVQKASGHSLLQGAARDAIRKWKFKPFVRDGQPVKATGFVTFNFSL
jgi:periplasmic protein TonB